MKWIVVAVFLATRMHGPNGEFQISDFPTTVSDYFIMAHLLPKWLRISIGLPEENAAFIEALKAILA